MKNATERVGRRAAALALTIAVMVGCDQYRTAALQRDLPFALPRPVDVRAMESAIETSLAKRHWDLVEHRPWHYVARLSERVHVVTIAIDYDTRGFAIRYLDSSNLRYERYANGSETIHRKYLTWVKNLGDDIRALLAWSGPPPPRGPVAAPRRPPAGAAEGAAASGPAPESP
jgi:hypothetical protein